jgi:hypothetical protein
VPGGKAAHWPKSAGTQRSLESPSMSGVRVGTWVAATHDDLQSVEVEMPALAAMVSLVVVRETVMAQRVKRLLAGQLGKVLTTDPKDREDWRAACAKLSSTT